jgi:chorismate synthase
LSGIWGNSLKLSIFGESHGAAVGIALDGLPPGFAIDWAAVAHEMSRRAPGRGSLSTPRKESDEWEVLSGVFEGRTAGTPLCAIIRNEGQRPGDYSRRLPRPGHADLTAIAKYKGCADYRGGGHFSGRLTAPLVFAGAIAKQILAPCGISIHARIARIHGVADESAPAPERVAEAFAAASKKPFPAFSDAAAAKMQAAILAAKDEGDSVGGVVECAAFGLPPGWGDPFFDSLESRIASMMFSIPAIKGIEFGEGFGFAAMKGSEANDAYRAAGSAAACANGTGDAANGAASAACHAIGASAASGGGSAICANGTGGANGAASADSGDNSAADATDAANAANGAVGSAGSAEGTVGGGASPSGGAGVGIGWIRALSNHNGGINGGISNGSPLIFRVAVKPTPTIRLEQKTVDLGTGADVAASFGGRHDPCIVPRALPAVEAGLALCLLDCKLSAAP